MSNTASSINEATRFATANGISLAYEELGSSGNPTVLLIPGLSAQLISWPDGLCKQLVELGFHVVRFDNRDTGLSERISDSSVNIRTRAQVLLKNTPGFRFAAGLHESSRHRFIPHPTALMDIRAPYVLSDLALDVTGLLDWLQVERAHLLGVSMGGAIAQHVALHFPERVRSISALMTTSGAALLPGPSLAVARHMLRPRRVRRSDPVEEGVQTLRLVQGPRYRDSEDAMRMRITRSVERAFYPEGTHRQFLAVAGSPSWTSRLHEISQPTLVVHGSSDPLIRPACGRSLARRIKGSSLDIVSGLGHDIPESASTRLMQSIGPHLIAASS